VPGRKFSTRTSARSISASSAARQPAGEIEGDAFLVAIDAEEIRAFAVLKGRPPRARVVAALRMLDLDHARAHVGREHRAVRPREDARQIEDGHARERRIRHNLSVAFPRVIVFSGDS
jgi:hypothetical protein